ncbi:hypothetical protein [Burkholderia thailandensis]|uniref:hypothetical protein n=1 Tax=Burkholderia thailandensis TaxID=57975 RepID=UPI0029903CC7|nr:hypothetical protein [Burkholderia thailandensis]
MQILDLQRDRVELRLDDGLIAHVVLAPHVLQRQVGLKLQEIALDARDVVGLPADLLEQHPQLLLLLLIAIGLVALDLHEQRLARRAQQPDERREHRCQLPEFDLQRHCPLPSIQSISAFSCASISRLRRALST